MHQPQAAKASAAPAQASDVGEHELGGVAHNDVTDRTVTADQHADLTTEVTGNFRQMAGELGGDDLIGWDATSVGSLERFALRRLDALRVAVDDMSRDRGPPSYSTMRDTFEPMH